MKNITVLFIALLLSSCASMHYGNFTPVSQVQGATLAQNSANQLSRVFPPAQHTFCMGQKVRDGFGIQLVQSLRKKGYGVMERQCPKQNAHLLYVLDTLEPQRLYRVSLFVGMQSLSRVYAKNQESFFPVSAWTHKE